MTRRSFKRKASRLGSLSKADLPITKKDDASGHSKVGETVDSHGDQLVQRCVIIQRAEKGYGLTVSGDNPVFVQSVKDDGAAALAGVQQGDRIIKVNGTLVTQSNHVEVVELIKSGSYVALTLLGRPTTHRNATQPNNMNSTLNSPSSPTDRITGPQPVDSEKLQQLNMEKIHTIRMMLEQDLAYLEKLRSEFAKNPVEKIRIELAATQKRCRILEEELYNSTGVHYDCGVPQSPTLRSVRGEGENNERERSKEKENGDEAPPLPPPRRFTLPHQMSLPNVTLANDTRQQQKHPPQTSDAVISNKLTLSQSLENIERQNNSPTAKSHRTSSHKQKGAGAPTHSRQRSSPDALLHQTDSIRMQHMENFRNTTTEMCRSQSEIPTGVRKLNSFGANDRRKCKDSPSRSSSFGTYDTDSPRITPPGTPPPPYGSSEAMNETRAEGETGRVTSPHSLSNEENRSTDAIGQSIDTSQETPFNVKNPTQQQLAILTMEDDDFPLDNESGQMDDHCPFNNLSKLLHRPTYMAVFMQFLILNSDPSNLFFYLVTELYKEGNAKEMKKWAYEIHSTYLVPGAPLKVNNIEENILHEIDSVLQHDLDKEDVLRKVFWKARKKALDELGEQLAEFRNKRNLGFGDLFGPPDSQLEDKSRETKVIEHILLPLLKTLSDDIENANNKDCALASSLATLLYKYFGLKSQSAMLLIDRCPTFVAKDKSRIKVFNRNKKTQLVQGHHFIPQHYLNVTYCNHCQLIIWGVGYQGYQCQNCEMNIHKSCVRVVEESCIGALRQKKKKDRMSGLMDNIMGKSRKPGTTSTSNVRKTPDENEPALFADSTQADFGDRQLPVSRVEKLKNRYETLCEGEERGGRETTPPSAPNQASQANGECSKQRTNVIGRSESLRAAKREHQRHSFRKRSDPSIPHSKSDAEDATASVLHPSASSSSCSSSTRSLDSPSTSLELLRQSASVDVSPSNTSPFSHNYNRKDDSNDSDLEAEADPPNWTESVDWDIVKHLKPKERKRQEVINELFHTERTHVRNLKVLDRVFFRPMQEQSLFAEHLRLLFPNLEDMLRIHGQFNTIMKSRTKESKIVERVGDLMLQMFDGQSGEKLKREAGTFCAKQAIALDVLKHKQKKDQKLAQFLADAEGNPLCRRLQLKDIIPTGMQRLTKYPLLIENLAKYTPPNTDEYSNLMRAHECSKDILNHVNQMVKEAENQHRLAELQKKLDKSSFEKADHPIAQEFRNLDLSKYKMIHEGPLQWRVNRQKLVELHVLLLENVLVLLQKQDDKYVLKFHKEETKLTHSPIIQLVNLLTRDVATEKSGFFLVSTTSTIGPQIYELVAISPMDRKNWIRYITEAVEAYTKRHGKTETTHSESPQTDKNEVSDKINDSLESQNDSKGSEAGEMSDQSDTGAEPNEAADNSLQEETGLRATSPEIGSPSGADAGSGASSEGSTSESPAGPFSRVEMLQISEGSLLIEPSEVTVSHGAVLQTAEPVLTPLEKLRRKDAQIKKEIEEKRQIVAEVVHLTVEEVKEKTDIETDGNQDAKDLILKSVNHATQLMEMINSSLNLTEEDAVSAGVEEGSESKRKQYENTSSMINTVEALNMNLSHLLSIIIDRDDERKRLRKELRALREQIHEMHEARCKTPTFVPVLDTTYDDAECEDDIDGTNDQVTFSTHNATQEVNQVPHLMLTDAEDAGASVAVAVAVDVTHESHV